MRPSTFALLFALLFSSAQAQVSEELATALQDKIDEFIVNEDLKGISAAILYPDGSLWRGTAGESHAEQPITQDMLFGIASITKTYTSTTVLSMYEEGLLTLDDSIHTYLNTFDNIDPNVTIRQLLNHSSGIYNYTQHPNWYDSMLDDNSRIWEQEELIEEFVNPPYFAPGTNWTYSNTNYALLGMIVESISGNLLSDEYISRIFEPAGLDSTFLDIEQSHYDLYAHAWDDYYGNGIIEDWDALGISRNSLWSMSGPAGGIVATASQVAKFSKALLHDQTILSQSTLDEMTDFTATDVEYGFGIYATSSGCENWIGHKGVLIYESNWAYLPSGISIVILHNQYADNISYDEMVELCQVVEDFATSTDDIATLESAVDVYPNPAVNQFTISGLNELGERVIEISVIDPLGRSLLNIVATTGQDLMELNATEIPTGIYFVILKTESTRITKKLIIRK